MDKVLVRLKNTAKLESLIASNACYEDILKQSQKIDELIVSQMKQINTNELKINI